MKILIIGGTGMLGHKLVQTLRCHFNVWCTIRGSFESVRHYDLFRQERTIDGLNIEDIGKIQRAIEAAAPDVVINAAGIIKQLPNSKDVIRTLSINSIFPHRLAELSETHGFRSITIGTDCVFAGTKGNYNEDDPADALDLYGQSKHLGEVASGNVLTLRTSIIGRELNTSHSLVEWFLANRGNSVNGYSNAIYSGFPTIVFADIIANLIVDQPELRGLYHVSSDPINKFELLRFLKDGYNLDIDIDRFEDFRIDRSLDSARFRKATGFKPASWPEMIERMCSDPTPYDNWRK